jgi:hypothetical protein
VLAGGVELKFRVEFHIAADLKALWLCLGLKNFVCPFCTQTSFNKDLHGTFDARELSGCLGVPSNRVHLCSLHATLRIVERLVKNAASFVYQHNEVRVRNQKFKALSGLIESKLKRKKFNITVGSLKEAKVEEALPADEVFIDNDASLGTNLGAMFQNNVHVKLSALTGSQAIKILEKEDIYMGIIDITEGEPYLPHRPPHSPIPRTMHMRHYVANCAGCRPAFGTSKETSLSALHGEEGVGGVCDPDLSPGTVSVDPPAHSRCHGSRGRRGEK